MNQRNAHQKPGQNSISLCQNDTIQLVQGGCDIALFINRCPRVNSRNNITLLLVLSALVFFTAFTGCASVQAHKDLNELEENRARGDPENSAKVKIYLENVIAEPEARTLKAYHRRAYSPENKKNIFMVHSFYVYFNEGKAEHTLVFTATPDNSPLKGTWMLDAATDTLSYSLFVESPENPWEVEEYKNPKHGGANLNLLQTTQNILIRLDKGYQFFGGAHVRNLAWYHQIWMMLTPPPVLTYAPLLLISIKKDSCNSAVTETMAWE